MVTLADDAIEAVRERGEHWWTGAVEPVISVQIPGMPGCFAFTTREGLRCDVVLETVSDVPGTHYRYRVAVLDRDGLAERLPPAGEDEPGPDADRMAWILREFHRQLAIFPAAVVAREDWLLGQVAVGNVQRFLYELLVEGNRPLPPMGVKQWSSKLTPRQRNLIAKLPVPTADRESVITAMVEVVRAVQVEGRAAVEAAGVSWPDDADVAVRASWRRHGLPG